MKRNLSCIVILAFIAVSGCRKKEYPQPSSDDAGPFYAKFLVNNQPVEIITGKNGYYMYTSYAMDSAGVYNLAGEYKQTGCSNCTNSLRIQINDFKTSAAGSSILIDSTLQAKSYDFLDGDYGLGYSVDFTCSFNNKPNSSVLWDFGDGSISTIANPSHLFKPGKYKVMLTITGTDMCQSVLANTLTLGSSNALNAYISASSTGGNTVLFTPHITGGKAPYTYTWNFGDGTQSTNASVSHPYALKGGYDVWLNITDANGETLTCYYNAVAGADPSACAADLYIQNITYITRRIELSRVSISYTDASGTTFTSDNSAQPASSGLQVLSVDEFVKNENNQPVKKVKVKFNCMLYNGTQSVSLQGTEVYVGFAYK